MRAVQITRFGGPEVFDVVDLPDPEPGPGEELFDVSAAGIDFADTHHWLPRDVHEHVFEVWTLRSAPGRPGGQ
jgi:NADPH:quinone reductase-like Zn-dependent oxidoreductase